MTGEPLNKFFHDHVETGWHIDNPNSQIMETISIWNDFSMQTRIACIICYAAVFRDVLSVSEIIKRLNIKDKNAFEEALLELESKNLIVVRDGFAALPHLAEKIDHKSSEFKKSEQLIRSKIGFLKRLGKLPIIKFIGISGSLAAGNPFGNHYNIVDIDIFIILRNQCIWFFFIPLAFLRLLLRKDGKQLMCFNYIMDESDLRIHNRNFYIANEIRNLIPVSGEKTYYKFLQVNKWVNYYFPGFCKSEFKVELSDRASKNFLNKLMFLIYTLFRCIKNLSVAPLREISFTIDPLKSVNFNRLSSYYGGYQTFVQRKFSHLFSTCFPKLMDENLMIRLFPDELSIAIKRAEYDVEKLHEEAGLKLIFSKYE